MIGSVSSANAYHTARNNVEWAAATSAGETTKLGALQKATDYVNSFRARFPGTKTGGRAQVDEWPRTNAVDAGGETLPYDTVPVEVENAVYEAAYLIIKGIDLTPVVQGGALKRKKVKAGPVETETEYSDEVENYSGFDIVENALENVLMLPKGLELTLLRA
mgnify:CR=1 FL=1